MKNHHETPYMIKRNPNITCEFTEADWEWWYKKQEEIKQRELKKVKPVCKCGSKNNHKDIDSETIIQYRLLKTQCKKIKTRYNRTQSYLRKIIKQIERKKQYNLFRKRLNTQQKIYKNNPHEIQKVNSVREP